MKRMNEMHDNSGQHITKYCGKVDLQNALDWACGLGKADCKPIQHGGACFEPDTLVSHASYAFNYYYQQNGNSDIACNFGGTATVTKNNPSYSKCVYASSSGYVL
ncbi:hypothetical protein Ddye_024789 [Dipteronia dyeriana]|uniref:X8 domain-containing protein n=1 Tax=Dipteronia dyeriana TaxID=168575 RepID=A0AAD9TW34_9ROSI|nr:hypothetical protein Ddye_024789 [Dipteronia dyeriana]